MRGNIRSDPLHGLGPTSLFALERYTDRTLQLVLDVIKPPSLFLKDAPKPATSKPEAYAYEAHVIEP